MKQFLLTIAFGVLIIKNSFAGNVTLYHMSTPTGTQLQSNFMVCGSENHSFLAKYTFTFHSSCHPNRYRTTFKLLKNGVEIASFPAATLSSTFSNQGFYDLAVSPGTYTVSAILERRPCAGGWYTAETITSNSIVVSTNATPNFTINGVAAGDPASNVPSIVCNAGLITVNALNTTCESTYWIGVWETTHNWWERTYDYEWGGWFQGNAPANINLQNLATTSHERWINGPGSRKDNILMGGLITGSTTPSFIGQVRYYTIELCTAEPSWTCKKIQIKVVW